MRVQITLLRVQPEIHAHATWIIDAQIKTVGIVVCDAGAVIFVKESESLLRSFSSTLLASDTYGLKQKEVASKGKIDLIHVHMFLLKSSEFLGTASTRLAADSDVQIATAED